MRVSTDFDKPGYWHAFAQGAESMEARIAARTGVPVAQVAAALADFFAHEYKGVEVTKDDQGGCYVLDQWDQGVCINPDMTHYAVGG